MLLAFPTLGFSTVFYVPDNYPTIQEAIDAAQDGDRIIVSAGTYFENIDFNGLSIKVQSAQGPDVTFIDGNQLGSVVTFANGEGADTRLEGFSIVNGSGTFLAAPFNDFCGGGILCDASSPTIENNIVYSCTSGYGGGFFCTNSGDPEITRNILSGNSATVGGGIFCRYSSPWIFDNVIIENSASYGGGGIACWLTSAPTIVNNLILDNLAGSGGGAGIRAYNRTSPLIVSNTVFGNETTGSGGALLVKNSTVSVINSIFWSNDASDLSEIWVGHSSTPSVLDIDFSDVQDGLAGVIVVPPSAVNWGAGMIDSDPLIHDPANGDFHLDQDPPQPGIVNPCVDAGDPNSVLLDGSTRTDEVLDVGILDMGYHYMTPIPAEPEIHQILPDNGPITGGTAVTLSGDYFTDTADTAVTFDGISATDLVVVDVNTITCTTPAHLAGAVDVAVLNSNGSHTLVSGYSYYPMVIHVPGDYSSIQNAIDASHNGGTVLVEPGVYVETINFYGKAIELRSDVDGDSATDDIAPESTWIDGNLGGSVVTFENGEGEDSRIRGFTIVGGLGDTYSGGGITCLGTSPNISENIITSNDSLESGGGLCFRENSSPRITNNLIFENRSDFYGAAIAIYDSSPTITNNSLVYNSVTGNGGFGGGISISEGDPVITNTIVWANTASNDPAISLISGNPLITYCDIEGGWTGSGNINRDPLFIKRARSNYRLSWQSACIDAGTNNAPSLPNSDLDGSTRIFDGDGDLIPMADIGCYELTTLSVPAEYTSIQAALNVSSKGNMVLVESGTYFENIDFMGKSVSLIGKNGPDATTIDAGQAGCAIVFSGGESAAAHLEGFTITNGLGGGNRGGAVTCTAASPTITGNVIDGNQSTDSGGGIHSDQDSSPLIENNTISRNASLSADGGALVCGGDSLLINNVITDNSALLSGGGIFFQSGNPRSTNNTIVENTAQSGGGIGCIDCTPTITNTILWNNSAPTGKEIAIGNPILPSVMTIGFSDVEGGQTSVFVDSGSLLNWNAGMIDSDPLFVDHDDFHLTWNSPCRDSGDDTTAYLPDIDFEGDPRNALAAVDMGADEYYYHLYYRGTPIPGQVITVRIVGYQGLPIELYEGSGLQDPPQSTDHGYIFIELPPFNNWSLSKIPANGVRSFPVTIPLTWSAGEEHHFQALIGRWGWNLTRLSNLMTIRVQ